MSPSQDSVDKYLRENYPPWASELDAYRKDLRAKLKALRVIGAKWHDDHGKMDGLLYREDVLSLLDDEK